MRRRLYLEWGYVVPGEMSDSNPSAAIDPAPHYEKLVSARKNLVEAITKDDSKVIDDIRNWLGGAVTMYATVFELRPEDVLSELESNYPVPRVENPYAAIGDFVAVTPQRPNPPPGAPKPVDPEVLAAEQAEMPEL